MRTPKPDGRTPQPRPFDEVTFPTHFPQEEVADHQVYMTFTNDSDALAFRCWWAEHGALAFAQWKAEQGVDGT